MFDLKKPCNNCPFRKGAGDTYQFGVERCLEIFNAPSFQCHKTVDYDEWESERGRQGKKPQQCHSVMSLLHRANLPNQMMKIAERLGAVDFNKMDHSYAYDNLADALEGHSWGYDWAALAAQPEHRRLGMAARGARSGPVRVIATEPTRAIMPNIKRAWDRDDGGESFY